MSAHNTDRPAVIEALTKQNLRERSPQVEGELVRLRVALGQALCERDACLPAQRPQSHDLFSGRVDLPEIPAENLNRDIRMQ